ncbi:hypothetical protein MTO96_041820 [Rhipicephalus appendiculatus]
MKILASSRAGTRARVRKTNAFLAGRLLEEPDGYHANCPFPSVSGHVSTSEGVHNCQPPRTQPLVLSRKPLNYCSREHGLQDGATLDDDVARHVAALRRHPPCVSRSEQHLFVLNFEEQFNFHSDGLAQMRT